MVYAGLWKWEGERGRERERERERDEGSIERIGDERYRGGGRNAV